MALATPSEAPAQSATATDVAQPIAMRSPLAPIRWWLFLAVTAYLLLYSLPFPFYVFGGGIAQWTETPVDWLAPRFAEWTLGLTNASKPLMRGSGDTQYDVARIWLLAVLSLVAAAPLSLRVRPTWRAPIAAWRDLYLRYWLAGVLFAYGVQKVLLMQMGVLTPSKLLQPLGMFSPAGLVWAFMAASPAYQRMAGWLELLPAALLLIPRTALLGAAVAVPVLANVVALNLFFDVPVKLYSMHLLATSMLLCLPAASGLLAALAGRAVPARPEVIPAATRGWLHLTLSFMLLMFTLLAWPWGVRSRRARAARPSVAISGTLVGVWDVVDRDPAAPPWQVIAVSSTREAVARVAGDGLRSGLLEEDSSRGTLTVPAPLFSGTSTINRATVYQYVYRADTLRLLGVFGTDSMGMTLTRRPPMRLLSQPFRWIQAMPDIR